MHPVHPVTLSAAQRAFLAAADGLGATSPAAARSLAEWPRLAARELDALVDRGLVREAGAGSYYAYTPRRPHADLPLADGPARARLPAWQGRGFKTLVFWLVALLIPVVFLLLMA